VRIDWIPENEDRRGKNGTKVDLDIGRTGIFRATHRRRGDLVKNIRS